MGRAKVGEENAKFKDGFEVGAVRAVVAAVVPISAGGSEQGGSGRRTRMVFRANVGALCVPPAITSEPPPLSSLLSSHTRWTGPTQVSKRLSALTKNDEQHAVQREVAACQIYMDIYTTRRLRLSLSLSACATLIAPVVTPKQWRGTSDTVCLCDIIVS